MKNMNKMVTSYGTIHLCIHINSNTFEYVFKFLLSINASLNSQVLSLI